MAEWINSLLNDTSLLLMVVGIGCIVLFCMKSIGKYILDENTKKTLLHAGTIFFILGFAWKVLPALIDSNQEPSLDTFNLTGLIKNEGGATISGVQLRINDRNEISDPSGRYYFHDLPLEYTDDKLVMRYIDKECPHIFANVPMENGTINYDIVLYPTELKVSGFIFDENDTPVNAIVFIDNLSTDTGDAGIPGYYEFPKVPCNMSEIKVLVGGELRYQDRTLSTKPEEKNEKRKRVPDIYLASRSTVDYAGKVVDSDGNPVEDAIVEIGGYNASTDSLGYYRIPGVSRNDIKYVIKVNENVMATPSPLILPNNSRGEGCMFARDCYNKLTIPTGIKNRSY